MSSTSRKPNALANVGATIATPRLSTRQINERRAEEEALLSIQAREERIKTRTAAEKKLMTQVQHVQRTAQREFEKQRRLEQATDNKAASVKSRQELLDMQAIAKGGDLATYKGPSARKMRAGFLGKQQMTAGATLAQTPVDSASTKLRK